MELNWLTPEVMWFLIGIVFLLAELGLPSFILIFFGIGAWATTLTTWITGIETEMQILVFVITSVTSLMMFRKRFLALFEKDKKKTSFADIDSDFVGKIATTIENVSISGGHVLFNGTKWKAVSEEEIPADVKVKIVSKENITLKIEQM